jgi:uncharacterized membrane protein YkoI
MARFPAFVVAPAIVAAFALAAAAAPGDAPSPAASPHPAATSRHERAAQPPHHAEEHHPPAARRPETPTRRPAAHRPGRRSGCVSQRGTIALVQAKRVVPLSAIRAEAERRGHGELINAELCHRGGRLAYLVSVLGENGKVAHMSFDAASGRIEAAGR